MSIEREIEYFNDKEHRDNHPLNIKTNPEFHGITKEAQQQYTEHKTTLLREMSVLRNKLDKLEEQYRQIEDLQNSLKTRDVNKNVLEGLN